MFEAIFKIVIDETFNTQQQIEISNRQIAVTPVLYDTTQAAKDRCVTPCSCPELSCV